MGKLLETKRLPKAGLLEPNIQREASGVERVMKLRERNRQG